LVPAEGSANAEIVREQPALAPASGSASANIVWEEPIAPSEGPDETSEPPQLAERELSADRAAPVEKEEESRPAPATVLTKVPESSPAITERGGERTINGLPVRRAEPVPNEEPEPVVANYRKAKPVARPTRIDGLEVRPAEPVSEADLAPPKSREDRARPRLLGTTPDGELVFEMPPADAAPRR
jgi:hypothetical protein